MKLGEALRIATRGLLANRLRSFLTIFGIMIGVAAVILLVALGSGASALITSQIEGTGSNLVTILPGTLSRPGSPGIDAEPFAEKAVDDLNDPSQAPNIATASPVASKTAVLEYGNLSLMTPVSGVTVDYPNVRNLEVSAGTFFTESELRTSARVVVLGQTPVDELFGGDPLRALDQTIKIERQTFRIIGTIAVTGGFTDNDNVALMPINTAWNYLLGGRGENITQIIVQATSRETVDEAENEATQILLESRNIDDPDDADFVTLSQDDLLDTINRITGILTLFLSAIAAISLIVGGIGVMNIMLVTVTERTREIGIRKAVGAKPGAILKQFLLEAIVLSGLGGLLGVLVGVGLSTLAGTAAGRVGGDSLPVPEVSIFSVVVAFSVSVGIGLFFGVYPARRAARLNPIEALRYE
ncbi:MAG: ABC transporter permease [Egibacteraceae bacterium]